MSFFACSLAAAVLIAADASVRRRASWLTDATIASVFASYPILFGCAMAFSEKIRYQTYDAFLYRIDLALGLDPFVWMRIVLAHRWLYESLMTAYMVLPIVLALAWIMERSTAMLRAVSIAPALAMVIYNLVPAVGPIHAFTPAHTLAPLEAIANSPRNAFPSMHLTWALLIALNAQRREWKIAAWTFVVITGMATICSGEHYYVDLLAAVPFSFAVERLAVWSLTHSWHSRERAARALRSRPAHSIVGS
jgi:hypothetical protein